MTTSASPTAATAMTEARTATWLMLATVRNWGAAIVTSAPSTTMMPTRLSSRWRAIVDSHWPGVRGAPSATVAGVSAIEATVGTRSNGSRSLVGGAPGRVEHYPLLGRSLTRDLGRDTPLVQHEDP